MCIICKTKHSIIGFVGFSWKPPSVIWTPLAWEVINQWVVAHSTNWILPFLSAESFCVEQNYLKSKNCDEVQLCGMIYDVCRHGHCANIKVFSKRWNAGGCSLYGTGVITHSPLPIKALSLEIILSQFSDNPDLKNFVRSKFWGQFLSSQRNIEWIRMAADTTSGNIWINHLDSFTFNNWPEAIKIIQTLLE